LNEKEGVRSPSEVRGMPNRGMVFQLPGDASRVGRGAGAALGHQILANSATGFARGALAGKGRFLCAKFWRIRLLVSLGVFGWEGAVPLRQILANSATGFARGALAGKGRFLCAKCWRIRLRASRGGFGWEGEGPLRQMLANSATGFARGALAGKGRFLCAKFWRIRLRVSLGDVRGILNA